MNIKFFDFNTDESIVAPIIYDRNQHRTTNKGVIISKKVTEELKKFLLGFNSFLSVEKPPYYRIDAYFDNKSLHIIEVNASFVDGWGTALNLSRASGININPKLLQFPKKFVSHSSLYMPELELFVKELSILGIKGDICLNRYQDEPVYVYDRVGRKDQPNIFPYDGIRLDNKMNLGLFSKTWQGEFVKIPRHYINRFDSWEQIPTEAVLKFCDKGSDECKRGRQSVIFGKPEGKAPFIKRCYNTETLLAQDFVPPKKQGSNSCQLIIFAVNDAPVTGYVQYSWNKVINDNSIHGPLQMV